MPCPVRFEALRIEDLPELNDRHTLYTFDPRAILDECLGKHRYIVSCENLLSQTLHGQHTAVNQYAVKLPHTDRNEPFVVPITGDPRPSLYTRLKGLDLPVGIDRLYVCIPHTEADRLAAERNFSINFSLVDFERYNDKIAQKLALGDLTPEWQVIDPKEYDFEALEDCYFKRANGAGGYATFHSSDLHGLRLPSRKYPARWYREATVEGDPCSVQIYKDIQGDFIVFGYSGMRIKERKTYAGGLMRRIEVLNMPVREQLEEALRRLNPLLEGYQGFMGLDFIQKNDRIHLLEANVRVTMATFATLELNASQQEELAFYRFR